MPYKTTQNLSAPLHGGFLARESQSIEPQTSGSLLQGEITRVKNTIYPPRTVPEGTATQFVGISAEAASRVSRALLAEKPEIASGSASEQPSCSRECSMESGPSGYLPTTSCAHTQGTGSSVSPNVLGVNTYKEREAGKSGLPAGHWLLEFFQPDSSHVERPYPWICRGGQLFDMMALRFFKLPISQIKELHYSNGSLIQKTITSLGVDGEPVIKRVIDPMSRTGAYSNYIRMLGFAGDIIDNDENPLVAITKSQIVHNHKEVVEEVKIIRDEIKRIGETHGFVFDDNLVTRIDCENYKAKKQKAISDFRSEVREFLNDGLNDTLYDEGDGWRIEDAPRTAALFYVTQNSTNQSGEVIPRYLTPGRRFRNSEKFSLPISIFHILSRSDKVGALGRAEGRYEFVEDTMEMIGLMHERPAIEPRPGEASNVIIPALSGKTIFSSENRWEILNSQKVGKGDFIIISGHYKNSSETLDEFTSKLSEYVVPAAERGGCFLINNSYSDELNTRFEQMGFLTEHNDNGYLLARNYTVEFDHLSLHNIRERFLAKPKGSIQVPNADDSVDLRNKRLKGNGSSDVS